MEQPRRVPPSRDELRTRSRRRAQRTRRVGLLVVVLAASAAAAGYAIATRHDASSAPRSRPATHARRHGATAPPTTATTPATSTTSGATSPASGPTRPHPRRPRITPQMITLSATRLAETRAYARRHYGVATYRLVPKLIVLHFTASGAGSEPGVHSLFESDAPNVGELPGVCAHFVVDQDGTIYQQAPLTVICRHTIGVNDHAIGIEMVQETGPSAHWADQQILHRTAQIHSVLALVRWLQARYRIPTHDVIGHAMANDSPFFHDLEGWRNDHTDWQPEDVRQLRSRL
jgi:N-acetylmuramoyl-L-alanine amidase